MTNVSDVDADSTEQAFLTSAAKGFGERPQSVPRSKNL